MSSNQKRLVIDDDAWSPGSSEDSSDTDDDVTTFDHRAWRASIDFTSGKSKSPKSSSPKSSPASKFRLMVSMTKSNRKSSSKKKSKKPKQKKRPKPMISVEKLSDLSTSPASASMSSLPSTTDEPDKIPAKKKTRRTFLTPDERREAANARKRLVLSKKNTAVDCIRAAVPLGMTIKDKTYLLELAFKFIVHIRKSSSQKLTE